MKFNKLATSALSIIAVSASAQVLPFTNDPEPTSDKIQQHQQINEALFGTFARLYDKNPAAAFDFITEGLSKLPKAERAFNEELILGSAADRYRYGVCSLAFIKLGKAEDGKIPVKVVAENTDRLNGLATLAEEKCGRPKGELPRFNASGKPHIVGGA